MSWLEGSMHSISRAGTIAGIVLAPLVAHTPACGRGANRRSSTPPQKHVKKISVTSGARKRLTLNGVRGA